MLELQGSTFRTGFSLGPLSGLPSNKNGPQQHGCGAIAENDSIILSPPQNTTANSTWPACKSNSSTNHLASSLMVSGPEIPAEEDLVEVPEKPLDTYLIRSLSRSALRMLWHQRLGHLNFRRLSTMHRFVKGMPEFTLPTALEECPVCLSAKLRKQPAGTASTMKSTVCNQGLSISLCRIVKARDDGTT